MKNVFFEKKELETVLNYIAKINANVKNLYIKNKDHKNYKEINFIQNFIDKNNYDIKITEKEFHNSNFENVTANSYLLNVIIESPVVFLNLDLDSTKIKNFVNNLSKNDSEYFFDKNLVNLISEVKDFSYNDEILKLLESKTLDFFKIDFNCDYNYNINALTTLHDDYVNKIRYFNYIIKTNNIELIEYFINNDKFDKSSKNKHFEIDGYFDFYETVLFTSRFENKKDGYLQYFYIKYANKLMEYITNEDSKSNYYNVNISEYLNDLKFINDFVSNLNEKNKECFLNMYLYNILYKYDNFEMSKVSELNKSDIYNFLLNLPDNILFFNKDIEYVLLNYYDFSTISDFGLDIDVELFNLFIDRIYKNEIKIDLKKDNNFEYLISLFSLNNNLKSNEFYLYLNDYNNDFEYLEKKAQIISKVINIYLSTNNEKSITGLLNELSLPEYRMKPYLKNFVLFSINHIKNDDLVLLEKENLKKYLIEMFSEMASLAYSKNSFDKDTMSYESNKNTDDFFVALNNKLDMLMYILKEFDININQELTSFKNLQSKPIENKSLFYIYMFNYIYHYSTPYIFKLDLICHLKNDEKDKCLIDFIDFAKDVNQLIKGDDNIMFGSDKLSYININLIKKIISRFNTDDLSLYKKEIKNAFNMFDFDEYEKSINVLNQHFNKLILNDEISNRLEKNLCLIKDVLFISNNKSKIKIKI